MQLLLPLPPLISPNESKERPPPAGPALDLQSGAISNNHQAVSFPHLPCLPPPPSLNKGKKELEPQLEIYHAIVYHEFLVNHIGEAGLFISETLNQYKVGLLVLKLGWSVKK